MPNPSLIKEETAKIFVLVSMNSRFSPVAMLIQPLAVMNNQFVRTLINQQCYKKPEEAAGNVGKWQCPSSLFIYSKTAYSVQSVSTNVPDALLMNRFITGAVGEKDHNEL